MPLEGRETLINIHLWEIFGLETGRGTQLSFKRKACLLIESLFNSFFTKQVAGRQTRSFSSFYSDPLETHLYVQSGHI